MQETTYFDNIFQMNRTTAQEKYDDMEKQINEFISYIKSQNLSPMEEIMMVYDKVKLLESAGNDTSLETRQLPDVIKSGKAVCAGYTNLFNEFLLRMGYKTCAVESYVDNVSHMHSLVEINDDKYDIHGIYNFDPTFDSLSNDNDDRTMSYAFFGRSADEINHLRQQRIPRGISIALMQGMDGKYNEVSQEIPTRTMNIVNGFFPSEENTQFLQRIYEQGKDRNNWPSLNENYLFQISGLGFKVRKAENIPCDKIEQIIRNVRKIQNPSLSTKDLESQMEKIKSFNNDQFSRYFSDSRLLFKIVPKNYVSKDRYPEILQRLSSIYGTKSAQETFKTLFEFTNDQRQQVIYRLESMSDTERKILAEYVFDSNYDFVNKFLNPMIRDYATLFSYSDSKIGRPEYFNINIRSYEANSPDGSSLTIKDGDLDYLVSIDSFIKNSSKRVEKEGKVEGVSNSMDVRQDRKDFFTPPNSDLNALLNTGYDDEPLLSGLSVESIMTQAATEDYSSPSDSSVDELSAIMSSASEDSFVEEIPHELDISRIMDEAASQDIGEANRINSYNQYRGNVLSLLMSSNPDIYVHSNFTVGGNNGDICRHTVEKISSDSRQILSQMDFQFDELFRKCMLEPSIVDYAKTNSIVSGNVETAENGLSQYKAFSETNNILTISNVTKEYAQYIDSEVKKVIPITVQQQMGQYQQQQMQNTRAYTRVLKKNDGFTNVLMLSSIIVFVAVIIFVAIYLLLK